MPETNKTMKITKEQTRYVIDCGKYRITAIINEEGNMHIYPYDGDEYAEQDRFLFRFSKKETVITIAKMMLQAAKLLPGYCERCGHDNLCQECS